MLGEFRTFIARGNVVDLAVAVVIGAAFGKIVASFVDDLLMPPVGMLLGGADFTRLAVVLRPDNPATAAVEQVAIRYGAFLNTLLQFVIVAFAVFLVVKAVNRMRRGEAAAAPTATETLLTDIRDLLRSRPAA